jgi:hypothetical protein
VVAPTGLKESRRHGLSADLEIEAEAWSGKSMAFIKCRKPTGGDDVR